jgi:RNA polymerase sigma-70 factor, ECF subfamily
VELSQPSQTAQSTTGTYILDGLRDAANETVWNIYVDRYRPMLLAYGRRLHLNETDAEDVAQQTLIEFCGAYRGGKYDREKGRLRDWLFGIARNQVHNFQRRHRGREVQAPAAQTDGTDFFAQLSDDDHLRSEWDAQWQEGILRQALAQVRDDVQAATYEAFDLFALQDWPAAKVAEKLGITENAVFGAKRRVLRRLREITTYWESEW